MPFLQGSLSVRRYGVAGEVPANLPQVATIAIRRYSFRPIDESRGEKESFGWVNPRDVLQDNFTYDDLIDGPYLLLGVRRDRKAFSQVIYKARRARLFDETKKQKGIQKLSRQHRLALEEDLTVEMLKETSPTSAFSELVWDLNSGMVLMGATGNALCERIQDLFEATFDVKLRPMFPALLGADYIASQGLEQEYLQTLALSGPAPQEGTPSEP